MESFIIGLIGNIIASFIYDSIRKPSETHLPPVILIYEPETIPTVSRKGKLDRRAINRERLRRQGALFFFYFFTLLALGIAIYLPLLLTNFSNPTIDLSQVKIINRFSTATIDRESILNGSFIIAGLLYLPVLITGDWLLKTVKKWYDNYYPVTFNTLIQLRFGTFIFASLFIAGVVVYLFTSLSFFGSILVAFIGFVFLWAYAASS